MSDDFFKLGTITSRQEVKSMYGGGQMHGILHSRTTPNIFLYTNPTIGEQSGYFDGWSSEADINGPVFEYTGHGEGNQTFEGAHGTGNNAVYNHKEPYKGEHEVFNGRTLRVFVASGKFPGTGRIRQRYIGSFKLDKEKPFETRTQPNKEGVEREVIVFRLRPIEALPPENETTIPIARKSHTKLTPTTLTISSLIDPAKKAGGTSNKSATAGTIIQHRESDLCNEFQKLLEKHQHEVKCIQAQPAGTSTTLISDLYDATDHVLYEAKGCASRENIRMAIGQLFDYQRHATPANPLLAILLPERPSSDLISLLHSLNIKIVYRDEDVFVGWPVHG